MKLGLIWFPEEYVMHKCKYRLSRGDGRDQGRRRGKGREEEEGEGTKREQEREGR